MSIPFIHSESGSRSQRRFATTRWSLVLQARGATSPVSKMALSELCAAYWLPLYTFVRRHSRDGHEAQDLTQGFFAQLLSKNYLNDAQPNHGRFRSFLLAAVKHFLANERDKVQTLKRGGGIVLHSLDWQRGEDRFQLEPVDNVTPERLFEREWALALLDRVLERLTTEQQAAGKQAQFEVLSDFLTHDRTAVNYAAAAERLQTSEDAARVAAHRLRKRYRQLLRDEIAQTTQSPEEISDELRCLFAALRS